MSSYSVRRVGSLPARPEFKEASAEDLRVGSGAAARFEKRHRMSHNITKSGAGTVRDPGPDYEK